MAFTKQEYDNFWADPVAAAVDQEKRKRFLANLFEPVNNQAPKPELKCNV